MKILVRTLELMTLLPCVFMTQPSLSAESDPSSPRHQDVVARAERERSESTQKVETVVVTGTYFHDVKPVAPILTFERDDFDRAGAATPQEFLALLPQNFGGAQSADTTESSIPGLAFDQGYGSSVNLRGVGGSSTLILIDGRRMASAGIADYSDISMIPLAAVERIEVMSDGASALYGSDAIGGVVNFIMRKDFSGAETRLRYADSTQGGLAQRQASQLLGTHWGSGNALLSYEYVDQAMLDRTDRDFSDNTAGVNNGPRPLIPAQETRSVTLVGRQDLSSRVALSANGLYSQRGGDSFAWDPDNLVLSDTDVKRKQYGGGIGLTIDLWRSWQVQVNGNIDKSTMARTDVSALEQFDFDSVYDLWLTEARLSGDFLQLPWGAIKLAIGASYLAESLDSHQYLDGILRSALTSEKLRTKAIYGELSIPIGEQGDSQRVPLALSLAGRYEDHEAAGSTFDPKVGLRWAPLSALSLYATYGTSFKVPSLDERQETRNVHSVSNVGSASGPIRALVRLGNSSDLNEETARTFTGGLEFTAPIGEGLLGSLSFFDIDYTDRVAQVTASAANVLALPAYESLVLRRGDIPDAEFNALLTNYLSGSTRVLGCTVQVDPATGACATPVSSVMAIIDRRLQNFSSVRVRGLDLSVNQELELGENRLNFGLNASYLLDFDQEVDSAAPSQDILNTLYNPVDLRFRGSAGWSHDAWSVELAVNHTDGYDTRNSLFRGDNTPMPLTGIDSWTTFDLTMSYRTGSNFGNFWLDDVGLSLSVSNLFDQDPPFVDDQYIGLGYDPANADPRGRFVSLLLSKSW